MLNPTEYHVKHHRLKDGSLPRIRECQRCIIAKSKCENKIVYKSRDCADTAALRINIERNWFPTACMKPYRCRHCMLWHLTTATRKVDLKRVDKMWRTWMRKTHQKVRDEDYGYGWERSA